MPLLFSRPVDPFTSLCVWHAAEEPGWLNTQLELDPSDEKILESIRNQNRKAQWLGCRMALSHLMNTSRIGIRYNGQGKPLLSSGAANISFSHTGSYAAAILSSTAKVGIDLEQVRAKIGRVAERFLTGEENSRASGGERQQILTLFWTVKEALYKIFGDPGTDIQHDICIESFDYLCSGEGDLTASLKGADTTWIIPVSYCRFDEYFLSWATVPENN